MLNIYYDPCYIYYRSPKNSTEIIINDDDHFLIYQIKWQVKNDGLVDFTLEMVRRGYDVLFCWTGFSFAIKYTLLSKM